MSKPSAFAVPTRLAIGDDTVTIKRQGTTTAVVANILGRQIDVQSETLWLDRMCHRPDELFEGWQATGAISTILHRQVN
jgi:hypothetical protein